MICTALTTLNAASLPVSPPLAQVLLLFTSKAVLVLSLTNALLAVHPAGVWQRVYFHH